MEMQKYLVDGLTEMLKNQEACDVMFLVDEKAIGAHKVVLAAQCKVLYKIAEEWSRWTRANLITRPLPVDNIESKYFEALLRFLYCGEMDLSEENVFIFLSASVRYKIEHLEKLCVAFIAKLLNGENVSNYMNSALQFQSVLLQEKCFELFKAQTATVTKSPNFLKLTQPALSAFLDAEVSNLPEIQLFTSLRQWMECKCQDQGLATSGENMRLVIGDALFKIRFPTMTVQDFACSVGEIEGLLTDLEKLQIFQMISVTDKDKKECPFSKQPRVQ